MTVSHSRNETTRRNNNRKLKYQTMKILAFFGDAFCEISHKENIF